MSKRNNDQNLPSSLKRTKICEQVQHEPEQVLEPSSPWPRTLEPDSSEPGSFIKPCTSEPNTSSGPRTSSEPGTSPEPSTSSTPGRSFQPPEENASLVPKPLPGDILTESVPNTVSELLSSQADQTVVHGKQKIIHGDVYNAQTIIFQKSKSDPGPETGNSRVAEDAIIEDIRKDLRAFYIKCLCKKQMYPWKPGTYVDLNDIFVPLTIDIKIPGARRQHVKKPLIPYTKFLAQDQKGVRFILSGDPGQGKSTFCAKLAHDWSEAEESAGLNHIRLLFILELGKLDRSSNIEDAICSQILSPDYNLNPAILRNVLRNPELGKSIAVVFDGLDEAPSDLLHKQKSNTGNVVKILQCKEMRQWKVLVTTRPWREAEILNSHATEYAGVYERLELRKMTKSDGLKLVTKFFNQTPNDTIAVALGKRLQKHIKQNKHFVEISTPLAGQLLCWYWAETDGKKGIPERRHQLYMAIFNIMFKMQQYPSSKLLDLIDHLGEVSVQGLTPTSTQILFTEEDMLKCCTESDIDDALKMGILSYRGHESEKNLQFFHKSGQEFCCGKYLANEDHPERLSKYLTEIHTVKEALSVGLVLMFTAGSKNAAKLIISKLMDIFKDKVKPLMSQYLDEQLPFDDSDETLSTLSIQQFIALILECNFEADAKNMFNDIWKEVFQDGRVLLYGISSKVAVSLAYCFKHSEPDAVRNLTLRPIAHPSHPFIFRGPNLKEYTDALQNMKGFENSQIDDIFRAFKKANREDLHPEWDRYTPAQSVANMACIAAVQHKGLSSASETNISSVIESFQHINLEMLDLNTFRLNDTFKYIVRAAEKGHLKSLSTLLVRATTSVNNHMTRLMTSLPKMPKLCRLDTSLNKVEAGKTIPKLAENLNKLYESSSLRPRLYMTQMDVPADDMALLVQNVPAHLKKLTIDGNGMNDNVAAHLMNNLQETLVYFALSVHNLSQDTHTELLRTLWVKLPHLEELRIYGSNYPADLLKEIGHALETWKALEWLTLHPSADDATIPENCMRDFLAGVKSASAIKTLRLYGIDLGKDDFEELLTVCEDEGVTDLRYSKQRLPEGVSSDDLDMYDFLILE
ncbi:uncharacterized protein [Amphiura filiformis]|uniref:uncharacterized protein n=1 Tax=Amphiura filiformis TaxID=82378 RepID=UPI003B21B361